MTAAQLPRHTVLASSVQWTAARDTHLDDSTMFATAIRFVPLQLRAVLRNVTPNLHRL
jgi:hypothetical protein